MQVQQSLNLRATPGGTILQVLPPGAQLLVTGTGQNAIGFFYIPIMYNNVSGAIIPVNTAYDYLFAQASTLGDYQGEGECPTRKPL